MPGRSLYPAGLLPLRSSSRFLGCHFYFCSVVKCCCLWVQPATGFAIHRVGKVCCFENWQRKFSRQFRLWGVCQRLWWCSYPRWALWLRIQWLCGRTRALDSLAFQHSSVQRCSPALIGRWRRYFDRILMLLWCTLRADKTLLKSRSRSAKRSLLSI